MPRKAYTPSSPDRAAEGELRYFYYDRLSPPQQKVYSAMVKAILAHEEKADADGIGSEDIFKATHAIWYDRPELFWFSTCTVRGNEILLHYGASAEEAQALQKQIDEAVKPYLEGITDAMSAYDVGHPSVQPPDRRDRLRYGRAGKAEGRGRGRRRTRSTICARSVGYSCARARSARGMPARSSTCCKSAASSARKRSEMSIKMTGPTAGRTRGTF